MSTADLPCMTAAISFRSREAKTARAWPVFSGSCCGTLRSGSSPTCCRKWASLVRSADTS
eukprot:2777284-Pleurochrysis_carterae.AAC.1